MTSISKLLSFAAVWGILPTVASAAIVGTALGSGSPPAMLGGYTMTPFGLDPQPIISDVTGVDSPAATGLGRVTFGVPLSHRRIGAGWATWSHGYTGDVYYSNGAVSVSVGLPSNTGAFYLYAQPNSGAVLTITATAQDGTAISQPVAGRGGNGYGFHTTDGSLLTSITVSTFTDFAIGEFGIAAIPERRALCCWLSVVWG